MNASKILLSLLLCIALASHAETPKRATTSEKIPPRGFAIVELYTSEGCSSCPAADALVGRIQKEMTDQPVYILSFHVDYWNRLGWKDQFSSQDFTNRQRQYAKWLNLETVYTPQVVVNGQEEFVGSNEKVLRSTITTDLAKKSSVELSLSNLRIENGKVNLGYQVVGNKSNASVIVAIVQKDAVTKVKSGENRGRTLPHVQVVRNMKSFPLGDKLNGAGFVETPQGLNLQEAELIAFVQDNRTGEILAATKSQLFK